MTGEMKAREIRLRHLLEMKIEGGGGVKDWTAIRLQRRQTDKTNKPTAALEKTRSSI